MATYRVDNTCGPWESLTLFRGVVLCEHCFESLGAVQSPVRLGGLPARLVAAMWPDLKVAVDGHEEEGCAANERVRP